MNESLDEIYRLNQILSDRIEQGDDFSVSLRGVKPKVRVLSLEPLSIEKFTFLHQAPRLVGEFAIHAILAQGRESGNVAIPWLAVGEPIHMYGIRPPGPKYFNKLARIVTEDPTYDCFYR